MKLKKRDDSPFVSGGSLGPRLTGWSEQEVTEQMDGQLFLKEMCPSLSSYPHKYTDVSGLGQADLASFFST